MIKANVVILAALLFGGVGSFVGCKNSDTHSSGSHGHKYTCTHHPEIVQDSPGSCPKCGMKLTEKH